MEYKILDGYLYLKDHRHKHKVQLININSVEREIRKRLTHRGHIDFVYLIIRIKNRPEPIELFRGVGYEECLDRLQKALLSATE